MGKSTLFNRLVGEPEAIVSDVSGTTRDRVMAEAVWADHPLVLVDTGGLEVFPEVGLWQQVRAQIEIALQEADTLIMVVDVVAGVTGADRDVADVIRAGGKPVVLAANKADNERRETGALEFYELGLGDPTPISAYHNVGVDDLMARVISHLPAEPQLPSQDADMSLAIVGRTNVGKSMLLNAITGEERAIVSEVPGTTRDSLDTLITHRDGSILLIDTAGIRRRGSIAQGIERYSVLRSLRAIDRADVAILVTDASEQATSQDTHIAGYILEAYKGMVIAVNKWDLASGLRVSREDAVRAVRERFRFASYAPICFTSALERSGMDELLDTAGAVYGEWTKSLPRYDLRRTVLNAVADHPPSTSGRRALKVYGVTQERTGPPSFTFYVNRSDMVHFSYRRYLENSLRAAYEFKGSPLRMRFRGRGES